MAVYAAVYVLPSWIENMLTDWDAFAHARRHTQAHTRASEQHMRTQIRPDAPGGKTHSRTSSNEYHTRFFFFLTNVTSTRFSQDCPWVLLCCQTTQALTCSYRSLLQSIHHGMSDVYEQVKFQVDKCQHVWYRTINLRCYLSVTPSYGSQISLIAYTPPPPTFHNLSPCPRPEQGQNGGRRALGEWSRLGPPH